MILTEKCKEKFLEWYWNKWFDDKERNHYEEKEIAVKALHTTDKVFLHALIIEFFDSVGVYIEIHYSKRLGDKFFCIINESINYNLTSYQDSRQEATIQAIKQANDLYNENNSM